MVTTNKSKLQFKYGEFRTFKKDSVLQKNVLYRPQAKKYSAIDFFMLEDKRLSMFQVMIRNRHDINANELRRCFKRINVTKKNLRDYYFYFVLPFGATMTRKQNFVDKTGATQANHWTQCAWMLRERR